MMPRARHFILATILTVATWGLAAEVSAEPTPVLRKNITIQGEAVRLGDIFDGAGVDADAIVAYAPAPGRRAIHSAYRSPARRSDSRAPGAPSGGHSNSHQRCQAVCHH